MTGMGRGWLFLPILALAAPLGAQRPSEPRRPRSSRERVVYYPKSVPAVQVNFLKDSDMVMGVAQHFEAKAYWLPMVIWVHLIQDRLGDLPILVTW